MKHLLTGATGFVGGAIARRLVESGDTVIGLVRDPSTERARLLSERGVEVRSGDLGDPEAMADAAQGCDVFIHSAALRSDRAEPLRHEWVNVAGTENALNAASFAGCSRFVFISCADVSLANTDRIHWDEKRTLTHRPIGAHARTKQLAEEVVLASSHAELECTALRPAWLWGPFDTSRLPHLCREGLSTGIRLIGGGTNLFATTYIDHLVDAVVSATHVPDVGGRAFYVTDGEFFEAREFFSMLSKALGLRAPRRGLPLALAYAAARVTRPFRTGGLSPEEVLRRGRGTLFDPQQSINVLGVSPRVSPQDGVEALADWLRAQGGPSALAKLAS